MCVENLVGEDQVAVLLSLEMDIQQGEILVRHRRAAKRENPLTVLDFKFTIL